MFAPDVTTWAQQVAARLRCVQADFADADKEQRHGFIEEEIQRSIKDIVPERRKEYIEALSKFFPQAETAQNAAREDKSGDQVVELTPEQLLERLIKIAPLLPKRKLDDFSLKLQQAGYLPLETTSLMDSPPPEFLSVFPIEQGQQVDLQRTFRLLQAFGEFYVSMDKVTWNIWRAIAPKSTLRRDPSPQNDIAKMGARYLSGDSEVSVDQIKQVSGRLRQLLAGILTAIGPAGRGFAQKHLSKFSPEAIKDAANQESGFFSSLEQKCWRKYTDLTRELNSDAIEMELQEAIARHAETLMRGTGRNSEA